MNAIRYIQTRQGHNAGRQLLNHNAGPAFDNLCCDIDILKSGLFSVSISFQNKDRQVRFEARWVFRAYWYSDSVRRKSFNQIDKYNKENNVGNDIYGCVTVQFIVLFVRCAHLDYDHGEKWLQNDIYVRVSTICGKFQKFTNFFYYQKIGHSSKDIFRHKIRTRNMTSDYY